MMQEEMLVVWLSEDESIDVYLRGSGNKNTLELSICESPLVFNLCNVPPASMRRLAKWMFDYANEAEAKETT